MHQHPYGKHPDELAEVRRYLETVEPSLRKRAGHEIDTSAPSRKCWQQFYG